MGNAKPITEDLHQQFCLEAFRIADNLRIQKGNMKASERSKKRRKILRAQKNGRLGVTTWKDATKTAPYLLPSKL